MDMALLLEYGWVLLVLAGLEGILAADNAVVMAVMVKHLKKEEQKKALFYGLAGAMLFRFASLFLISFLAGVWQVQAVGAAYLFWISSKSLISRFKHQETDKSKRNSGKSGFWVTVLKVEAADLAFAVDSMLAAAALAVTLPELGIGQIGGMDGGRFTVMFLGGMIGLLIMRFAASSLVKLLQKRPALETAAFFVVGWTGVKLAVSALSHPSVHLLPEHFPETLEWKSIFWAVLLGIIAAGWVMSGRNKR